LKVLITGANGFVGKNLTVHLSERKDIEVLTFVKGDSISSLDEKVQKVDFIFHLAGINRPKVESEFTEGNVVLTIALCESISKSKKRIPVIYTSSIQAELNNAYGISKKKAEEALLSLEKTSGSPVYIYRLPNVFGKWCKPNYNSAVATFCYNIANNLPVQINDANAEIKLVYIDDVIASFLNVLDGKSKNEVSPVYTITVGELQRQILAFKDSKINHVVENVGTGLTRALYSTYLSYFTPSQFSYPLLKHEDPRGVFVEMLKTKDSGQFSFFTAHKGVTRGGHYHHTKTEKFLVVKGEALFKFRHLISEERFELKTNSDSPVIVETIPGWTHDITNIGEEEMFVMIWANEIFDRERPDTIACKV
jgi:UDP-2-acetamido-2,6-beta-L-arabino-hexul-4-ose reductase